jgi:hypothetical protein
MENERYYRQTDSAVQHPKGSEHRTLDYLPVDGVPHHLRLDIPHEAICVLVIRYISFFFLSFEAFRDEPTTGVHR